VGDLTINRSTVNGLITGSTLGVVTDMRSYNTFGELSNYSAAVNASPIFSVQYTRDKLGRIIEKSETVGVVSKVFSYSYDISSRLAEVKEGGITVAAYTYDSNGNRLSYAGLGGTTTYTYDDQDRLLSLTSGAQSQNFTYTGNGELSGKTAGSQNTVYQYDELGNLLVVSLPDGNQVTYVIDGKNRRIGKKVNNVLIQGWLYQDRLRPAAELDGSGNPVSRFVYGSRRNVPDYLIKDGTVYRIISDHLGSVRLVVDTATGTIMQRMDYDAFGNVTLDTSPGFQPFGYAGGLYDRDTRLTRFGARDYDAETGRWTVKDPIRFAGGDPNLYRYVSNNPVNRSDQSGLSPVVDSYPTSEDAAEAAMNEIYIQSKATDSEMGGYIYQNPDLTYSYTDPVTGETGTCTLNMPKPPDTAIGFYHSHPNMCSAEFSNLDKEFIKKQELLEMYVITPEGETLVYACY